MTRRESRRALRLLQALLASLVLAVVITPAAGAAVAREASVMMAERPGGSPPSALRTTTRATASRGSPRGREATFALNLAPTLPARLAAIIVRDLLRVTHRILC